MIKLSIIVPIYNGAEFIVRALDSIPKRDDIEVLCIDDGSTDDTFQILSSYNRLPIKIFHNQKNMGIGYSSNIGLTNATGEYITGLDIDDYFLTDIFNECLNEIELGAIDIYNFKYLENNGDIRPWEKIRGLPGAWIKKSFIGNTRFKNKTAGADICFYWELRSKYHSEINLNKIIYRYNFPRKGSVSWGELHDKA